MSKVYVKTNINTKVYLILYPTILEKSFLLLFSSFLRKIIRPIFYPTQI